MVSGPLRFQISTLLVDFAQEEGDVINQRVVQPWQMSRTVWLEEGKPVAGIQWSDTRVPQKNLGFRRGRQQEIEAVTEFLRVIPGGWFTGWEGVKSGPNPVCLTGTKLLLKENGSYKPKAL